jgi:hypothetical protein
MPTLPTHQWLFEEADGTTAFDSVGHSNATLVNATRVKSVVFSNTAVQIDGSDGSLISFGKDVGQFGTADFTIAFWVNTRETVRVFDLIGNRTASSHGNFICIRMTGNHESMPHGQIIAEVDEDGNGTNYVAVIGNISGLNDGQWHNVSLSRQGSMLSLYIDGVLAGSQTGAGVANIANGNDFRVGRSLLMDVARFSPNALFADVRIYNEAVTPKDLASPVISYPFYAGVPLQAEWVVLTNPTGPAATPNDGFLRYSVTNQTDYDQWLQLSIAENFETTNGGCCLVFSIRANTIQSSEVKFTLAADVVLRFTSNGGTVSYQYWDNWFYTLGASNIHADGQWHQIVMFVTNTAVTLIEDGVLSFTWNKSMGNLFHPTFSMQVLDRGGNLSLDLGDIWVLPPTPTVSIISPYDYAFLGAQPPASIMSFRTESTGSQVTFFDGFARFSAKPQSGYNKWSFLDIPRTAKFGVYSYWLRVNSSGGSETKITLPGDNILRLTNNGQQASWALLDEHGWFQHVADTAIRAGQTDFTVVTLICSANAICIVENGVFKGGRNYPQGVPALSPGFAVQHLDNGTDVSVDVAGFRTVPATKEPAFDYDQYFWIVNSVTGGALSLNGSTAGGSALTTLAQFIRSDQLWKFKAGMLVSKYNGYVLQVNGTTSGSAAIAANRQTPVPASQTWAANTNGTLISAINNLALHCAQPGLGGVVTAIENGIPGEWIIKPFVPAPDISENQLEYLPPTAPFSIQNGQFQQVLTATGSTPGSAVNLGTVSASGPTLSQTWIYDGTFLKNQGLVLDCQPDGLTLAIPGAKATPTQSWLLTSEGFLGLDSPTDTVLAFSTQISGTVRCGAYSPLRPLAQVWSVVPLANTMLRDERPAAFVATPEIPITSLKVQVKVSDDFWSGTEDSVYISLFPQEKPTQLLLSAPERGESKIVTIDLSKYPKLSLKDINYVGLHQEPIPHPIASDAWKLESLVLVVNDRYYNYTCRWVNQWINNPTLNRGTQWSMRLRDQWTLKTPDDFSHWMSVNYDKIKDKSLRQLTLPGSHDAGMYSGGGLQTLGKTQDLTIYQQLCEGVRYFDLRPNWGWTHSAFYLYHGYIQGPLLSDVFDDIAKFMREPGCKELVVIKLSHSNYSNEDYVNEMVRLIFQKLGPFLCPPPPTGTRLADIPMSQLIATLGRVMVVVDQAYSVENFYTGIYTYRDWESGDPEKGALTVFDRYSNTTDAEFMISDQTDKFNSFDGRCHGNPNVQCDLFLLSWTLTPATAVWYYAKQVNPLLSSKVLGMKIPNLHGQRINVLYVDYVEHANVTAVCLYLNGIPN